LIRSISVYIKKDISKYTRPVYNDNLSREISIYNQKNIIKFISACKAKEQKLIESHGFENDYANAAANADANADNNINTKYLNIGLLTGIVLILGFPTLIQIMSGVSIYDQTFITESIYSKSLINIRITCATVFVYFLAYWWIFNIDRLKRSILNKPLMSATIIVTGGFDNLGDIEPNDEHETTKPPYMLNKNK
jgi:hypothetical protein